MSLPRSIAVPALLAIAVALLLGGFLLWQLDAARSLLQHATGNVTTESGSAARPLAPLPVPTAHGASA